jgi:proton-coupled amino acid transporter
MSYSHRNSPPIQQISGSPGSVRGRSFGRAEATARLASPATFGTSPRARPAQSVAGDDSGSGSLTPLPLAGRGSNVAGPGVSALAAALSGGSLGASPPRFGTPPVRNSSPGPQPQLAAANLPGSGTPPKYGSFDSRRQWSAAYEDPEIIKRHLVQPGDGPSDDSSRQGEGSKGKQPAGTGDFDDEFSSLKLQGGDITRPIYKWTEEVDQRNRMQRSKSFSMPRPEPETEELDINHIKVPGGFRRNFIRRNARDPEVPENGGSSPRASSSS